jgi:hypothetical protein
MNETTSFAVFALFNFLKPCFVIAVINIGLSGSIFRMMSRSVSETPASPTLAQ